MCFFRYVHHSLQEIDEGTLAVVDVSQVRHNVITNVDGTSETTTRHEGQVLVKPASLYCMFIPLKQLVMLHNSIELHSGLHSNRRTF